MKNKKKKRKAEKQGESRKGEKHERERGSQLCRQFVKSPTASDLS